MCVCGGVWVHVYCVHLRWFGYTCMCLCREIRVWHQASRLLFPFFKSFLRNMTQSMVAILVDYIFALGRPPWKKTWNALPHGQLFLSPSIFSVPNRGELMEKLQWIIHRKRNKNLLEWPWPSNTLSSVVVLARSVPAAFAAFYLFNFASSSFPQWGAHAVTCLSSKS